MKIGFFAAAVAALLVASVVGSSAEDVNPVKERQKLMRSVGKGMKTTAKMLRGELKYDAAAVSDAMKNMNEVAAVYPTLFPKGSDMDNSMMDYGEESDAKADIWANMDDFKAKAEMLKTASAEAMTAAADKAAFGAKFKAVAESCKACHSKYKADKE